MGRPAGSGIDVVSVGRSGIRREAANRSLPSGGRALPSGHSHRRRGTKAGRVRKAKSDPSGPTNAAPAGSAPSRLRSRDRAGRRLLGRDGLDLASALLVRLDRFLQVAILLARKEAKLVEPRQVLLGLRQVVEGQIGLADVLVGAAVLRGDGARLPVDCD